MAAEVESQGVDSMHTACDSSLFLLTAVQSASAHMPLYPKTSLVHIFYILLMSWYYHLLRKAVFRSSALLPLPCLFVMRSQENSDEYNLEPVVASQPLRQTAQLDLHGDGYSWVSIDSGVDAGPTSAWTWMTTATAASKIGITATRSASPATSASATTRTANPATTGHGVSAATTAGVVAAHDVQPQANSSAGGAAQIGTSASSDNSPVDDITRARVNDRTPLLFGGSFARREVVDEKEDTDVLLLRVKKLAARFDRIQAAACRHRQKQMALVNKHRCLMVGLYERTVPCSLPPNVRSFVLLGINKTKIAIILVGRLRQLMLLTFTSGFVVSSWDDIANEKFPSIGDAGLGRAVWECKSSAPSAF
ncbi:hypothetical protein K438DRAFT_2092138 [Mycena galopus ATCC 62051]|nr:hypothetical protein K438DRAFT_2092138 [Mycena galopus ATCC 62051]